jgi:hypothetical protein
VKTKNQLCMRFPSVRDARFTIRDTGRSVMSMTTMMSPDEKSHSESAVSDLALCKTA